MVICTRFSESCLLFFSNQCSAGLKRYKSATQGCLIAVQLLGQQNINFKNLTMQQVKEGDVVRVHYTGKLINGEQFDSSVGREPLEFTVGAGMMIKGFDAAMPGMSLGEKKTINIAPEDAYGERTEEAIIAFPRENVPADMQLEPGMPLTLSNQAGQPVPVIVVEVKEDVIVLDANHFLAGQELVFDIELVEIV
jgi:peptidylprolyl isomerase